MKYVIDTSVVIKTVIELSQQFRQSVYDCLYVALAEREGCEVVTADGSCQFSEADVQRISENSRKLAQLREGPFNSLSAWTPATNSNRMFVKDGSAWIGWSTWS